MSRSSSCSSCNPIPIGGWGTSSAKSRSSSSAKRIGRRRNPPRNVPASAPPTLPPAGKVLSRAHWEFLRQPAPRRASMTARGDVDRDDGSDDEASWRQWLRRHGAALLLLARQHCASRDDAEDAVQEGFI